MTPDEIRQYCTTKAFWCYNEAVRILRNNPTEAARRAGEASAYSDIGIKLTLMERADAPDSDTE